MRPKPNQNLRDVASSRFTSVPPDNTVLEEQNENEADNKAIAQGLATGRPQKAIKTADSPEFQPWAGQVPDQHTAVGDVNLIPPSRDAFIVGDMVSGGTRGGESTMTEDRSKTYLGGPDLLTAGADQFPDVPCALDVQIPEYPIDRTASHAAALKHQTGLTSF